MAKRREQPANGLGYAGKPNVREATRKGGKDTTAVGQLYQRKTYVVERDQVDRIHAVAKENGIGINELVRWILGEALDAIDAGAWELPIEEVTVRRLVTE